MTTPRNAEPGGWWFLILALGAFVLVALLLLRVTEARAETLDVEAEISAANLSGSFSAVQGGVDASLNTWRNHNSGAEGHQRASFATPAAAPGGAQRFRARIRKSSTGGGGDPLVYLELWQTGGGSALAQSPVNQPDDSTTNSEGIVMEWDWTFESYPGLAADGSDVELYVRMQQSAVGPFRRASLESAEWVAASASAPQLLLID